MKPAALATAAVMVMAMAAPLGIARADGDQALSAGLGWATFSAPGVKVGNMAAPTLSPDIGGELTVSYERSLSGDIGLRGELVGGIFHGGAQTVQGKTGGQTSYAGLGDAGVVFRFDVLKFVPYAFGGLGAITTGGGPLESRTDLVLVVGGGLDWLQNRERSLGLEARVASFGGDVTLVTVGVRGTLRWDTF